MQGHDGVGRLECRRTPPLRLHAGMGGSPSNDDPKVRHTLAGRDDVPVLPGSLQYEAGIHALRPLQDEGSGKWRTDLLVWVADIGDGAERSESNVLEHVHRVEAPQQPPLHVGDARSVGSGSVDTERALRGGPLRKHGVHVPDQEDPSAVLMSPSSSGHQRVAEAWLVPLWLVRESFGRPSPSREPLLHEVGDPIHA